ncbi:aldehyde dehydrogenase family protein [Streptomyces jeddahensis]|uniref:Aldehyde dehydrogenase PuuC n=1 Tax=Streptomyces jeddahensis TaxID=1716141 RepID=A0A177HMQ3_9ACTN|nr:aldehyde dehydrogenase family protein [Streptomyces jeddahensis]OAH11504.1 aldehyde dehydrogenase PuuC [Streptomyces jeddahensis]
MQTKLFIGGDFVDAADGATFDTIDPHDGSVLAHVAEARREDVDRAVAAARKAFPHWSRMPAADRGRLLLKLADAIEADAENLALLETRDTGHPLRDTLGLDVPRTAATFRYFGGMADKFQGTVVPVEAGFLDYVVPEPLGVIGQIVPWNFPVMFVGWKLGPALAAGNCVVMKPSEVTPLTALRIAELAAEVGFPPGVINMVPGYGQTAGQRIVEHPDITKLSFTGSSNVGKQIAMRAADTLKQVHLELGGKGANIVFADAQLEAAVNGTAFGIFHNQGQACIAASRLIVHESLKDEFLDRLVTLADSIRLGDPKDRTTEMGPLTSKLHWDRVISYLDVAAQEGGTVLAGGKAPSDPALADGYYIRPTIVETSPDARAAREEVFGPFMVVHTFKTDEEALEIANSVDYGLGGGLWTSDLARAHKTARELRAGMVWVNSYKRVNPGSPFGGVGISGYGREMGFEAMREYTEPKATWINVDAELPPFYPRG